MKKLFFLLAFCIYSLTFALPIQDRKIDPTARSQLASALDIPQDTNIIIKANLPDPFLFDVVGPGVDPASHPAAAAITLDAIARWAYQASLISSKEKGNE